MVSVWDLVSFTCIHFASKAICYCCHSHTDLRHHVSERVHDPGTFGFLIIWEAAGYDDHSS